MITEDYVSFETAKLLKEKGFDERVERFFNADGLPCRGESAYDWNDYADVDDEVKDYSRPTLQMAMKWLREVHNYDISICLDSYVEPYDNQYYIVIRRRKDKYDNVSPCEQVYFDTYEEACEAGIRYCLECLV